MGNSIGWNKVVGGWKEKEVEISQLDPNLRVEYLDHPDYSLFDHVDRNGKTKIRQDDTMCEFTWFEHPTSPYTYRHGDLPSSVDFRGNQTWTDDRGRLHRDTGPARIFDCKRIMETVWVEKANIPVTFTRFYDCSKEYYSYGDKISQK